MRSTIEQWRMFKAVAEHGGFHKAAEIVFKSQSSIHRSVHKMEHNLGIKLVTSQNRKTTLTPAGVQLLRRINFLLKEVERIEDVASEYQDGIEPVLTIAIEEAFPREYVYSALTAISAIYPNTRIEWINSALTGPEMLLSQGEADIAISSSIRTVNYCENICSIEFVVVAHHTHPLHHLHKSLTSEDLKSYRQIILRDPKRATDFDFEWLGSEQLWTVNDITTSIGMLLNNLGFARLPRHLLEPYLASGELKPLHLNQEGNQNVMFHLSYRNDKKLGPVANAFIANMRCLTT